MAGSETAGGVVMTSREPFTLGGGGVKHNNNNNNNNNNSSSSTTSPHPMLHHSHPQPVIHNIRLAYSPDGTAVYKPLPASATSPPYHSDNSAAGGGGGGGANTTGVPLPHDNLNIKRKRGRPRKYGVVDASMALALSSPHPAAAVTQPAVTFSPPPPPPPPSSATTTTPSEGSALPTTSSLKKGRGRPPGSSKKQQMEALGSAGVGFTPHIISVKAGEDVSSKIMSFSQIGPRAVCVLSANGTISNVTLRQAATSGGTATYEGRFDILSLSGSFMLTEVGGQRSRTGGLSVSLAGPDGRVLGGCVAGLLTAASPVQVIVGSFIADGRKETKAVNQTEPLYVPHNLISAGGGGGGMSTGGSSPPSRGTLSGSSGGPGSPLNQSTGAYNNNSNSNVQGMSSMPWK